jgi:sugar O-acyltransferase (sialic acid O-acetyltransferase NeuD family)
MIKNDLYIIGAGSVGGHLAANLEQYTLSHDLKGFFDDDPEKHGCSYFGVPVVGPVDDALHLKSVHIAIGIAFPNAKKAILEKLAVNNTLNYPNFIHPSSWISNHVTFGQGIIIYPGTSINYGSSIGDFAVFNMNCALGHHTKVGNCVSFAPGVNTGGHTAIGDEVEMGIGCSTLQGIHIGDRAIIGGQCMVTKDTPSDCIAKGVPASFTPIKKYKMNMHK